MKKTLLIGLVSFLTLSLFSQTTHTVLAGGTPDADTPDPYFDPQHITIQQGDIVFWDNIEGWHNITTTAGPVDFSFGPSGSGWTHQFTFNEPGFYEYECSVGEHALTQFGSITVEMADNIDELDGAPQVYLSPNPVTSNLNFSISHFSNVKDVQLMNITGEVVWKSNSPVSNSMIIDMTSVASGMYYAVVTGTDFVVSKKVIKK